MTKMSGAIICAGDQHFWCGRHL